ALRESHSHARSSPSEAAYEWAAHRQSPGLWAEKRSSDRVQLLDVRRNRKRNRKHGSAPIGSICRSDCSVHGFDEASRNCETKPGTGKDVVKLLRAIELIEDPFEVGRRNTFSLVQDLEADGIPVAPTLDADSAARWSIFGCIVQEIEEELLKEHGVDLNHWQILAELYLDAMLSQDLARTFESTTDDFTEVVQGCVRNNRPGLQLGHVEQVRDEPVEPFGLADDRGDKVGLFLLVQYIRQRPQRFCRAQYPRERRLEIMRDRGQQCSAQAICLGSSLGAVKVFDQTDPFNGERGLIHQGVEQSSLIGRQHRPRFVAVDPQNYNGAAARGQGQEQAFGARKRVRSSPRGPIALPCPGCGRQVGRVERVLRRIACLYGNRAVLGKQQDDTHFEHQGDL